MSKPNVLLLLVVICSCLLAHIATSQRPTKPTYFDGVCDEFHDDYDYYSNHSSNVRTLLEELRKQANKTSSYNSSAGKGEDKVYGQYYCRADIDSDLCAQCIDEASHNHCIGGSYAVVWYEECTLRYDNQSMVGIYDEGEHYAFRTSSIMVNVSEKFDSVLNNTLERIISKAANDNGSLGYATGEGAVSESETLYCLAQCSPDLDDTQCDSCLHICYSTYILIDAVQRGAAAIGAISRSSDQPADGMSDLQASWVSMFESSCQLRYSNHGAFYGPIPSPHVPLAPQSAESPHVTAARGKKASYYVVRAVIPAAVIGSLSILGISLCLIQKRHKVNKPTIAETGAETTECVQFDLKTIEAATNSFSVSNKLGQGGFGIVYQGILNDGQGIAVKRLSKSSGQGTAEFKTEVAVLAKLQHKNLVQLVGCCVDGEERLLIYEFLSNLSLDRFLFDVNRSAYLTWTIRHKIIQGIARGLHYLHEDLRVKIVHRDLKTSNVLLDDNLEPKIADFGMARLVKVDQTTGNTTKVVGTYGYMSPEYALAGRYSTKSDVYSFGVIVLEILSGKNNNLFYDISHSEGLLQHAWRAWNGGAIERLMNPIMQKNYLRNEAERCLQIGLLCVQDDATCRPTMHAVLLMLSSNTVDLPPPLSPSHYNYINNVSSDDGTQENALKQQENGTSLSSTTFSAHKDLYAR